MAGDSGSGNRVFVIGVGMTKFCKAFDAMLTPVVDVAPIEIFGKVVHGEQDFWFHRPVRPGDVITTRARAIGYDTVDTGARLSIHVECRAADGELVNEQYLLAFFRNVDAGAGVGESVPDHKLAVSTSSRGLGRAHGRSVSSLSRPSR